VFPRIKFLAPVRSGVNKKKVQASSSSKSRSCGGDWNAAMLLIQNTKALRLNKKFIFATTLPFFMPRLASVAVKIDIWHVNTENDLNWAGAVSRWHSSTTSINSGHTVNNGGQTGHRIGGQLSTDKTMENHQDPGGLVPVSSDYLANLERDFRRTEARLRVAMEYIKQRYGMLCSN